MVMITIQDEKRTITDVNEVEAFLSEKGIWYEKWAVEDRVSPDASADDILDAYKDEIDNLKDRGGFVTADVIAVTPETPNLDAMLAKFSKEHTHSEDEVRFTVKGSGVFHIHPDEGPVFGILVEQGDMVNVPKDTKHWFDLCDDKTIRCIRLFQDPAGWTPHYVDNPINENYIPVCLGPNFIPPSDDDNSDPVVRV